MNPDDDSVVGEVGVGAGAGADGAGASDVVDAALGAAAGGGTSSVTALDDSANALSPLEGLVDPSGARSPVAAESPVPFVVAASVSDASASEAHGRRNPGRR